MNGEVFLPLVCTLAVVVVADCEVRTRDCGTGRFYDVNSQTCNSCSVCPADKIVKRPCMGCHDVSCGDFTEFDQFNQHGENPFLQNSTVRSNGLENQNQTDSMSPDDGWKELSVALVVVLSLLTIVIVGIVLYVCWRRRRFNNKETSTVVYQRGSQALSGDVNPEEVPSSSDQQPPEARYVFV